MYCVMAPCYHVTLLMILLIGSAKPSQAQPSHPTQSVPRLRGIMLITRLNGRSFHVTADNEYSLHSREVRPVHSLPPCLIPPSMFSLEQPQSPLQSYSSKLWQFINIIDVLFYTQWPLWINQLWTLR